MAISHPGVVVPENPAPEYAPAGEHRQSPSTSESALPDWALPALGLLGIYAAVRIAVLVADVLAAHVSYAGDLDGPLTGWDAQHYLQIAAHGYPAVSPTVNGHLTYSVAGFEPVFPLFVRLFAYVTDSYVAAALVVSIVGGAVGTLLVWRLATALRGDVVGFNSAVLFVVFPGMAIPWGIFYSESVGLALVAGCLLLIMRERWVWAGVIGAIATATNPLALPLSLAAAAPAVRSLRRREAPGALVTVALVPVGFLAFAGWLGLRYHDALFWWHLQNQAWGATVDFGKGLILLLPHFWSGGYVGRAWLEWIGVVAVAGAVVALWRARLPAFVSVYCVSVFD
ncbi:MAG: hypothetical protein ACRDV4_05595, partial [Acidimicrobiales bacterium]